jgi:predicted O-methyltransferase YrrM
MGIVHPGVPQKLALWLRDKTAAKDFIETGTYLADTTLWAAQHFDRVVSIEADPKLYDGARERLALCTNVYVQLGRSQDILSVLVRKLSQPALIWLDAHWCGGDIPVAGKMTRNVRCSKKLQPSIPG